MGSGSGIRKKPILDPGSRGQKSTGSRIRIRNTGKKVENLPIITIYAPMIYTAPCSHKLYAHEPPGDINVVYPREV